MTLDPITREIARLRAWAGMREAQRTMTRAEYLRDPAEATARAECLGPVTITDEHGAPRMVIHCPRERLAYEEA